MNSFFISGEGTTTGGMGAGTVVTRKQVDSRVSAYVRSLGYAQVPQLEGTATSIGEKVFT